MSVDGQLSERAPFELAALDMAGTTIDEKGLVYRVLDETVTTATGGSIPADLLARWKGTSKREAIAGLLAALESDSSEAAVDEVFAEFTDRLAGAYGDHPPVPFPGVVDALVDLRERGVRIALQTGYSATIADAILAGMDWRVGAT